MYYRHVGYFPDSPNSEICQNYWLVVVSPSSGDYVTQGEKKLQETLPAELTGIDRASLLLISLGAKAASQVIQLLPPREIQIICAQIARHKTVDPEIERIVREEFEKSKGEIGLVGGLEYAREILEQSLGTERAAQILGNMYTPASTESVPFEWLHNMPSRKLAASIENERPQVVAIILANLPIAKSAEVISMLPEELQGDVAYRLAGIQVMDPSAVAIIEQNLRSRLVVETQGEVAKVDGLQSLVAILNSSDRTIEGKILERLSSLDPSLAETVKEQMFVFDDIVKLDNRAIQLIIRELEADVLRLSIKGASEPVREVFYRNMSERAAESLKEEMELMGRVRRSDVEEAQKKLIAVMRRLDEAGEISLRVRDDDMIE